MPNYYKNKVVYGNNTLVDLTSDTITAAKMLSGVTAHAASGAPITGTMYSVGQLWITNSSSATPASTLGVGTWRHLLTVEQHWDETEYTWDQATMTWDALDTYYIWQRIS